MIVKLLTEHHMEFLSLKGGCRGSSESTYVKMSYCWKSYALAHISFLYSWSYQNNYVVHSELCTCCYTVPFEEKCSTNVASMQITVCAVLLDNDCNSAIAYDN